MDVSGSLKPHDVLWLQCNASRCRFATSHHPHNDGGRVKACLLLREASPLATLDACGGVPRATRETIQQLAVKLYHTLPLEASSSAS